MIKSLKRAHLTGRVFSLLLTLLLLALAPSPSVADQYLQLGNTLLTVPPPTGFVSATDERAGEKFAPLVQSMSHGRKDGAQLYLTPAEIRKPKVDRHSLVNLFMLAPVNGVDNDEIKKELFDVGPSQLDALAQKVAGSLAMKSSGSMLGNESKGVFRQEPWGAFLSFRTTLGISGARQSIGLRYGIAIIQVNRQLLTLISMTLDDSDAAQATAQNTMSAWADAIRLANPEPASVKTSKLYKLAPWLILLALALLGYFLFFRNKDAARR